MYGYANMYMCTGEHVYRQFYLCVSSNLCASSSSCAFQFFWNICSAFLVILWRMVFAKIISHIINSQSQGKLKLFLIDTMFDLIISHIEWF